MILPNSYVIIFNSHKASSQQIGSCLDLYSDTCIYSLVEYKLHLYECVFIIIPFIFCINIQIYSIQYKCLNEYIHIMYILFFSLLEKTFLEYFIYTYIQREIQMHMHAHIHILAKYVLLCDHVSFLFKRYFKMFSMDIFIVHGTMVNKGIFIHVHIMC